MAYDRWASFWGALPSEAVSQLEHESSYSSLEEMPLFLRDSLAEAVVEEAELIGFWVAWHRAGGFGALERGGWHRATIYRKARRFRARFGSHPDEYRFPWIALDLKKAWSEELDQLLDRSSEPDSD
jgi:hypothetical protein